MDKDLLNRMYSKCINFVRVGPLLDLAIQRGQVEVSRTETDG